MGKEAVDAMILDATVDQMVDWAAGIGAGKPDLAVKILATMFNDRYMNSADDPDIEHYIQLQNEQIVSRELKPDETAPHELLRPYHFRVHLKNPRRSSTWVTQQIRNR
jgi:hypothetical protein